MKTSDDIFKRETVSDRKLTRRTIMSFSVFALLLIGAWFTYKWISNQPAT